MKIVIWNCNMAFDKKQADLLALEPDVAIVSESANPDILAKKAPFFAPRTKHWHGENINKGLSVFTFGKYEAELATGFCNEFHWIIPLRVTGPTQFNLIAVWAKHPSAEKGRMSYQGPVLTAIDKYDSFLSERDAVVAGDFNNNVIWDKPGKAINHANTVHTLKKRYSMISGYHHVTGCSQGNEKHPTLFWQHNINKTYHVDHCFVPQSWADNNLRVSVGSADNWLGLSDHAPMVIELNN